MHGNDRVRDDRRDRFRRVLHLRVNGQQRLLRRRLGQQAQQNLGEDAQRAFRADENLAQRIAGHVLHALVADPHHVAVRQHDLEAHDVILRHAILQPAQAARVARDVAADGRNLHRARDRADRAGPRRRPGRKSSASSRPARPSASGCAGPVRAPCRTGSGRARPSPRVGSCRPPGRCRCRAR